MHGRIACPRQRGRNWLYVCKSSTGWLLAWAFPERCRQYLHAMVLSIYDFVISFTIALVINISQS